MSELDVLGVFVNADEHIHDGEHYRDPQRDGVSRKIGRDHVGNQRILDGENMLGNRVMSFVSRSCAVPDL